MEVAIIDWQNIDSRFVEDALYEHINAPKWVDFAAPDDHVDDEAWFCRPSCNHPKTVEDFFKEQYKTPPSKSKLQRSASGSEVPPFGDRNRREQALKKRGTNQPVSSSNRDPNDSENRNPNFSTPPNYKARVMKEAFKSSAEKKPNDDTLPRREQTPRLKSTLSARNLFSGGDLLNKVAEFCNELKKLATRAKDSESAEGVNVQNKEKQEPRELLDDQTGDKEKERKPLLELETERSEVPEKSNSKKKPLRKKRNDDSENTPISVDVKNIKYKGEDKPSQIRTYPPTPQCISASRAPIKATPTKAFKFRPQERGILQEVKWVNKDEKADEVGTKNNSGREASAIAEKDARPMDVFWFLKPCTLSS